MVVQVSVSRSKVAWYSFSEDIVIVKMAARIASAHEDCVRSTDESKVAAYLSLKEQKRKQLNKNLNAAASQAEKEAVFREYLDSIYHENIGEFIFGFEGECNEKWEASRNKDYVVLSTLVRKHGCMHIVSEWCQSLEDKMQPCSGLRMQPLDEIMCANCTPTRYGVAKCEKRGMMGLF